MLFFILGVQIEFRVRSRAASRSHQRHQYAKGHLYLQIITKPMTSITLSNNCENFNFDQFVEQLNQKNQMGKNFASKLSLYQQQLKNINSFAHRYDPKLGLKTNGFRSFLKVRQDFLMYIPMSHISAPSMN